MAAKKTNDAEKAVEAVKEAEESVVPLDPDQPLNAVIVIRVDDPDGGLQTRVAVNGDVRVGEVQTLLEVGLKGWREQIGLNSA